MIDKNIDELLLIAKQLERINNQLEERFNLMLLLQKKQLKSNMLNKAHLGGFFVA